MFGRGISDPEDPGVYVPDHTGGFVVWIEIGSPSAARLHKVTKQAQRVLVYSHKGSDAILADLASGTIHKADEVVLVALDPAFVNGLAATIGKKNHWSVLRSDGELYVTVDGETHQTTPAVHGR